MTEDRVNNERRTGGFIYRDTKGSTPFKSEGDPVINAPTLYLGDAAAGIYIDVSEHKGETVFREVGVKKEDAIASQNEKMITLKNLANYLPGYAYLNGKLNGTPVIYDQSVIPRVEVTNSTDKTIIFKNVNFENKGFVNPRVFLNDKRYVTDVKNSFYYPELNVISGGTGDVELRGLIPLYNGTASFIWTGEEGGKLLSTDKIMSASMELPEGDSIRPLWAHKLNISGAAQIGLDANNPVYVWMVEGEDGNGGQEAGLVDAMAKGDVFLSLTPVRIDEVESLEDVKSSEDRLELELTNVTSEEGNVTLYLETGRDLYTTDGVSSVTIPVPGTLEYGEGQQVTLTNNYDITGRDMLEYYLISYDPVTEISAYELPNGTVFYMHKDGKVLRIEEGGTVAEVGSYVFNTDKDGKVTSIELGNGISIDLKNGTLTVDEFTSFEVLLKTVSADWLEKRGLFDNSGNIVVKITKDNTAEGSDTADANDARYTLEYIDSWGGLRYYKLSGSTLSFEKFNKSDEKNQIFLVAWDKANDRVIFYQIAGTKEQTETNTDAFKNLMVEKSGDNVYVETHDGNYRDRRTKDDAFWGTADTKWLSSKELMIIRDRDSFVIKNFLESGYDVTVTHKGKEITGYYVDGVKLDFEKTPLGTTLIRVDGTDHEIYRALKGAYWNPNISTYTLKEGVPVLNDKGEVVTYINANRGENFVFTEPTYKYDFSFSYKWKTLPLRAQAYTLNLEYVKLQEISASLSNESTSTADRYPSTDAGNNTRYIYPVYDKNGNITGYEEQVQGTDGTIQHIPVTITSHVDIRDTGLSLLQTNDGNTFKLAGTEGAGAYIPAEEPYDESADGKTKYYYYYEVDETTGDIQGIVDDYYVRVSTSGTKTIIDVVKMDESDQTDVVVKESEGIELTVNETKQTGRWTSSKEKITIKWTEPNLEDPNNIVPKSEELDGIVYTSIDGTTKHFYKARTSDDDGLYAYSKKEGGNNRCHRRGQPIQTVRKVDTVHRSDDGKIGQRRCDHPHCHSLQCKAACERDQDLKGRDVFYPEIDHEDRGHHQLSRHLLLWQQTVASPENHLQIVVDKTDDPKAQREDKDRDHSRIRTRKREYADQHTDQDHNAAHRRGAGLLQMGLNPLRPLGLSDFQLCQNRDQHPPRYRRRRKSREQRDYHTCTKFHCPLSSRSSLVTPAQTVSFALPSGFSCSGVAMSGFSATGSISSSFAKLTFFTFPSASVTVPSSSFTVRPSSTLPLLSMTSILSLT